MDDDVKEIYEKTAFDYEDFVIPCKICQYNMLLGSLDLDGDEKAVDIGCGPGELTCMLAEKVDDGEVLGIDLSPNMIEIASKKAQERGLDNVDFIAQDYLDIEYEDRFDVCVSSYLFHWLSEPESFIRWVKQVLKTDGKLALISPSSGWYKEIQEAHSSVMKHYGFESEELVGKEVYPQSEIEGYLEKEGFEIKMFNEFCFREKINIESCLKRVDAKSDRNYFRGIPEDVKKEAIKMFFKELKDNVEGLMTTESGYMVLAVNR